MALRSVRRLTEHTAGINKTDHRSYYATRAIATRLAIGPAVWMFRYESTETEVRTISRRGIWAFLI
jgi:hypothetical protein